MKRPKRKSSTHTKPADTCTHARYFEYHSYHPPSWRKIEPAKTESFCLWSTSEDPLPPFYKCFFLLDTRKLSPYFRSFCLLLPSSLLLQKNREELMDLWLNVTVRYWLAENVPENHMYESVLSARYLHSIIFLWALHPFTSLERVFLFSIRDFQTRFSKPGYVGQGNLTLPVNSNMVTLPRHDQ